MAQRDLSWHNEKDQAVQFVPINPPKALLVLLERWKGLPNNPVSSHTNLLVSQDGHFQSRTSGMSSP
jgi:hypothetical protein